MMKTRFLVCVMTLMLICGLSAAADAPRNPLPAPGFEENASHWWTIGDDSSKVLPEAAHTGKMGLRIGSMTYNPRGASVTGARLPVAPGQAFTLTFWAKGAPHCAAVYLNYFNAAGKSVTPSAKPASAKKSAGQQLCGLDKGADAWNQYSFPAEAPEGAAFVALWIHSFSGAAGLVDLDDFALVGLAGDAAPIAPAPPRKVAPKNAKQAKLPERKAPPIIVIKLDDVKQVRGNISAPWRKVADFFKERKLKAGFGVICDTLPDAQPAYVNWLKELHDAGLIEFWFHGWDHAPHAVNGDDLKEFSGRTYEDQLERFTKSQKLAQEKLGFAFTTFGPPGSGNGPSQDANTYRAMQDEPHMTAWLYPAPQDDAGKALEAKGKVAILDRVWQVNIESAVGVPDYQRFLEGYQANPQREYFVLQGHPWAWAGGRFDEFVKIIDFLQAQKAVFMTPSELVAHLKQGKS